MTPAQFALLLIVGLFVAMFSLPIVLGFLAGLWEKRLVWPYVKDKDPAKELDPIDPYFAPGIAAPLEITEYAIAVNEEVEDLGFQPLGHFFDGKGKIYKLRYDFWLAPDRLVLVMVGGGTLAGIPLQATWLYTRLRDGRCLVTIDDPKGGDSDPTGQTLQHILANADFSELMSCHRQRIDQADALPLQYSEIDPLADHRAFRAARAAVLVDQGWARYLDPQDNWYKYTAKGAFLAAVRSGLREWKRAFKQKDRQRIPRPGQAGYTRSGRRSNATPRWMERLQFICWMMIFTAAFTFARGPARHQGQRMFRLVVPMVGLVGLVGLSIARSVIKRSDRSDERSLGSHTAFPAESVGRRRL
jgi:hypothetical protein